MADNQKPEVLAPAGSFDSMKAAVSAGADGVYIAVSAPGHTRIIRIRNSF